MLLLTIFLVYIGVSFICEKSRIIWRKQQIKDVIDKSYHTRSYRACLNRRPLVMLCTIFSVQYSIDLCLSFCPFFFWPLYCLSAFYLRLLITTLVSSNSSCKKGDIDPNYHTIEGHSTMYRNNAINQPDITPGCQWGLCYSIFSFMCMFCGSLFVLLYFFFWPLCCLSFDLRILITPLVSSSSSY